jgi:hypothetical protein
MMPSDTGITFRPHFEVPRDEAQKPSSTKGHFRRTVGIVALGTKLRRSI